jgi:hypothetical protein
MENLSVGSAYFTIIAKYHVSGLWGCGSGRFPVQNVYKMTNGDENATFEPLNL